MIVLAGCNLNTAEIPTENLIGVWIPYFMPPCWSPVSEYFPNGEKLVRLRHCDESKSPVLFAYYKARWEVKGDQITETIYKTNGLYSEKYEAPYSHTWKIETLEANKLVLTKDGETKTYVRPQ